MYINKNSEKFDLRIVEEAPLSRMLSKAFLFPSETPEAELAHLIDKGRKFKYEETKFYKVRSGKEPIFGNRAYSRAPIGAKWWDMPWLNMRARPKRGKKTHARMLNLLKSFTNLFYSIKKEFVVTTFQDRVRCDKLLQGKETCYIYVDANKRMGILGYLVSSKQLHLESIPIRIARLATEHNCKWMNPEKSKTLFEHPFKVLRQR